MSQDSKEIVCPRHKISVVSCYSRCADRLKNNGCCYFNKMINNPVNQDHLSMFSVSVEFFRDKMS